MKMIQVPAPDFDLAKTLNSGQVFHWEKIDSGFVGKEDRGIDGQPGVHVDLLSHRWTRIHTDKLVSEHGTIRV